MTAATPALDPDRWHRLSPLLDELMELEAPARAARLEALRAGDAAAAVDLERLLHEMQAARDQRFLERTTPSAAAVSGLGSGSACGAWTLERPLGAGGMGTVWLARRTDGRYDAQAAIKLPHPGVLMHGGAERFEREGRLLARLSHPHIAALLDAGVAASGQPYLVLEAVHGVPIDRYADEHRLTVDARIALFLDVLSAVAHAHGQFVLHRDLKPSNILIDGEGRVKLLDFGIARLIDADEGDAVGGTRIFTPDHAAPEQLQGRAVGVPADIYALGVLLYQLLAGRHPTARPTQSPMERLQAVAETLPVAMSEAARSGGADVAQLRSTTSRQLARQLHGDLDTVVAQALRKAPAERYASAAAFAEDLRRWRDGWPVVARPDRLAHRTRLFVRRHRLAVGAGAVGVLLLLGGTATTAWQALAARRERDEARWQAERALARGNLFNLMLGQMGRLDTPLTQRQVLDAAVSMIERSYGSQPRLAVELLLPIAGQYATMGDARADLSVMQRAARFAADSGDAALVAQTACSTVDTYVALDRHAEAEAAIAAAQRAIGTLADPPVALRADCWRYEAELAEALGQYRRALDVSLRARRLFEDSGNTDGNLYPSLLGRLITLYRANGDPAAALATADQLLERHRSRSTQHSLEASMLESRRAVLLGDAGELRNAHALLQTITARFSSDAVPPLLLFNRVQIELDAGRAAEARAVLEHADRASRTSGAAWLEVRTPYLRAWIDLAERDAARAREELIAAERVPGWRRMHAMGGLTQTPGAAQARVLLVEGRTADAAAAIEAELQRLDAAGDAHLARRAEAWRTAAEIQLAAGDAARAESHARAALAASSRAARDPDASAHVGHARLLLARARLAAGDQAGARDEAARAAAALARGAGVEHPLAMAARQLAGR